MSLVFLDIETIPADWTDAQKRAFAAEQVPGNYSKPESIAKWIDENADACYRKTSLDWRHGRVLCIGTAIDGDAASVAYEPEANGEALLEALHGVLDEARRRDGRPPVLVGHYILGFDLPRLRLLAARHRHPVLKLLPSERWSKDIVDTMDLAAGPDPRALRPSLDDLAAFLGIPSKADGMDGSKVYEAWRAGEHDRVRDYCAGDVTTLRAVFHRLRGDA